MPFWYHFPLPSLPCAPNQSGRLVKRFLNEGAPGKAGTEVLVIQTGTAKFIVTANGEGAVRIKLFPAGAELPPGAHR